MIRVVARRGEIEQSAAVRAHDALDVPSTRLLLAISRTERATEELRDARRELQRVIAESHEANSTEAAR